MTRKASKKKNKTRTRKPKPSDATQGIGRPIFGSKTENNKTPRHK